MAKHERAKTLSLNFAMPLQPSSRFSTRPISWLALCVFLLPAVYLSVVAGSRYQGNPLVFAAFSLLCNALLLNGFRKKASFFDTFIGLFFWLGFFLKLAIRVAFLDGQFTEPVGSFDGSGAAYDLALTVPSVAFAALLLGSFIRQRLFPLPRHDSGAPDSGLYRFYCEHRRWLLLTFVSVVIAIAASNAWLGIYQRGMIARTVLPFGMNGAYKWLVQFGLASISALVIQFEIARARKLTSAAILIPLVENFLCNVSLLSRGMILNGAALAIGTWHQVLRNKIRVGPVPVLLAALSFAILFGASVFAVNYLRTNARLDGTAAAVRTGIAVENATYMSKSLFIDRWVGMEGVMAVTSSKELGWDLWREAWREKYDDGVLSMYDSRFISSPYKGLDQQRKFHYVSLPGLVAFLYYTGSVWFVFVATLVLGIVAGGLEAACYRWCGRNLVLCSLFAQVIAFRYASFGYVPSQSYLLFGSIVLNAALIMLADALLTRHYARALRTAPT